MKEFKQIEKARILAMAKSQYNMFIVKRLKLESKLAVAAEGFGLEAKVAELEKKHEEALSKLRQQFEAKTQKLRDDIAANKEEQKNWTPAAIASMLDGHDIEELIDFSYETDDSGKRRLQAAFKYPNVLPPTGTDEAEALGINEPELPMPEEQPTVTADDIPFDDNDSVTSTEDAPVINPEPTTEQARLEHQFEEEKAAEQADQEAMVAEESAIPSVPVADEEEAVQALEENPWDDNEIEEQEEEADDENPFGSF